MDITIKLPTTHKPNIASLFLPSRTQASAQSEVPLSICISVSAFIIRHLATDAAVLDSSNLLTSPKSN